jgi:hypothetical protein
MIVFIFLYSAVPKVRRKFQSPFQNSFRFSAHCLKRSVPTKQQTQTSVPDLKLFIHKISIKVLVVQKSSIIWKVSQKKMGSGGSIGYFSSSLTYDNIYDHEGGSNNLNIAIKTPDDRNLDDNSYGEIKNVDSPTGSENMLSSGFPPEILGRINAYEKKCLAEGMSPHRTSNLVAQKIENYLTHGDLDIDDSDCSTHSQSIMNIAVKKPSFIKVSDLGVTELKPEDLKQKISPTGIENFEM